MFYFNVDSADRKLENSMGVTGTPCWIAGMQDVFQICLCFYFKLSFEAKFKY